MSSNDPRIDAYIEKSADFARPILRHVRKLVHKACPTVEETMKWSMPHFDYKGEMMCSMAAFKQHCVFGFWKAALMKDADSLLGKKSHAAMGNLGRITSLKEIPADKIMIGWIREAMKLNEEGKKLAKNQPIKYEKVKLVVPVYFKDALKKNKKARYTFEAFTYSHKKEYLEWITEAKTDETRKKRISQAIEWMSDGKTRHWKYLSNKG